MERVDDDRPPAQPGEQRRRAPDRARLGRVGVHDVRPHLPDDPREPDRRDRRRGRGASSRESPGRRTTSTPACSATNAIDSSPARDVAGDERRLVAALGEAAREVGDVERGTAHVEARDHPQHADRAGGHRARAYREHRATLARCRVAKTLFWGSLGALAWTHVGYPLAAGALARVRERRVAKDAVVRADRHA